MCHPETRKAVQEDIFSWITHGQEEPQPKKILWMSGPAGFGKAAIAGTVVEECEARGLLAGSFFCSSFSGPHKRRSKCFVIATLAYQLMQNDSTGVVRKSILSSIQSDPTVFRKRLKVQCRVLLLQPFQNFRNQGSLRSTQQIIVIDGLDEIENSDSRHLDRQEALRKNEADQVEILSSLHATHHPAFPFRILIFSCPKRGIREFFASQQAKDLTLEVFLDDKYNPDDDIELFLRSKSPKYGDGITSPHPGHPKTPLKHWCARHPGNLCMPRL
jgi:nucleoside-triphosphatase THEP1